jgi:hypothetical protein
MFDIESQTIIQFHQQTGEKILELRYMGAMIRRAIGPWKKLLATSEAIACDSALL